MPQITSPHSIFSVPAEGPATAASQRPAASQSTYCYLFPALAQDDRVGCFSGTTPGQTFARLEAFEESSREALSGLPVLPMRLPAVYTYFGQFVNHDISAPVGDVVTRPSRPAGTGVIDAVDPTGLDRTRRAKASIILKNFINEQANPLALDSLYGEGPASADPGIAALYEPDGMRFRLGLTRRENPKVFQDLGKDPAAVVYATGARDILRVDQKPMIADRRNDENLIISQLHLALMLFHNKMIAALEGRIADAGRRFAEARAQVLLQYHWLILNDFLPNLLSPAALQTPLADRPQRLTAPRSVPLEFTTAAFRFGHSMVGSSYDFNANFGRGGRLSAGASLDQLFDFTTHRNMGEQVPQTLQLPDHWVIDWDRMGRKPGPDGLGGAEKIDMNFAPDMLNAMGNSEITRHGSILFRNLVRGFQRRIAFGQALAAESGQVAMTEAQMRDIMPAGTMDNPQGRGLREIASDLGFLRETPAWLYFLAEARHHEQGERLGPTASHIIADTFVGLMKHMPGSVLCHQGGTWHPRQSPLKAAGGRPLTTIRDLLRFSVKDTALPVAPA